MCSTVVQLSLALKHKLTQKHSRRSAAINANDGASCSLHKAISQNFVFLLKEASLVFAIIVAAAFLNQQGRGMS